MDRRVKPGDDAERVEDTAKTRSKQRYSYLAAYAIALGASPASHGFHHSFSPRSRAMMPALM